MAIDSTPGRLSTGRTLTPTLAGKVLTHARALHLTASEGRPSVCLKGKNIGLLTCNGDLDDAALFSAAATELGAHVARVSANLSGASSAAEIADTARLLGRLYDAVECQGLPERVVQLVSKVAGIPVFDGIACADHPCAALADGLDPALGFGLRRRLVVQALIVDAIG